MSAKRTRKDKQAANHQFLYSWKNDGSPKENSLPQARVKRERKFEPGLDLAKDTAKKDIFKSLIVASFILSLELVLYLAWK